MMSKPDTTEQATDEARPTPETSPIMAVEYTCRRRCVDRLLDTVMAVQVFLIAITAIVFVTSAMMPVMECVSKLGFSVGHMLVGR